MAEFSWKDVWNARIGNLGLFGGCRKTVGAMLVNSGRRGDVAGCSVEMSEAKQSGASALPAPSRPASFNRNRETGGHSAALPSRLSEMIFIWISEVPSKIRVRRASRQ